MRNIFVSRLGPMVSASGRNFASSVQLVPLKNHAMARSALLIVDSNRYLLNCCEGVQHSLFHNSIGKIRNVFLTKNSWERTGGIPGFLSTLCALNEGIVPSLHLHGLLPKDFLDEVLPEESLRKCDIKLPVNLEKIEMEGFSIYPFKISQMNMGYMFKFNEKDLKIDLKKLQKYDFKDPKLLRNLKAGESVFNDGILINPKDIAFKQEEFTSLLVLDCQTAEEIEKFSRLYRENLKELEENKLLVVHFSDEKFIKSLEYQNLLESTFNSENILNIFMSSSQSFYALEKHYKFTQSLNNTFPGFIRPDLDYIANLDIECYYKGSTFTQKIQFLNLDTPISQLNGAQVTGPGMVKGNHTEHLKITDISLINDINMLNHDRNETDDCFGIEKMPEITFIGTGSAIPSAMRNASSILVKNNDHYIIMDSGENALFNIFNVFGSNKGHEILTKLEFIFISHAHMDHFVGLFSLINYWSEANSNNPSKKLNIVCHEYISQLVNFFTSKWNCKQTEKCKFITSKEKTIDVNKMAIINEFGLDGISFCKTIHINSSIGLRLDFKSGFSLSYSGDTRYCPDFVKLSKHVDLMIHEATFENKLADRAKITNHSTNEDALHATINSECKYALLTHFSQRYDKCPRINNKVDGKEISNFGIAYDNLFVNERNISSLGKFYCLVKKALENHSDEMMQEKVSRFSQ